MSPITHALTGWLLAQPLPSRRDRTFVTIAAVIPDIDGLSLLGGVEAYQKYHHTFGHNIFAGITFGLFCYSFSTNRTITGLIGIASFHSHLLEDLLGSGADWGIPYFWPLSNHLIFSIPPFQWELDGWQNIVVTCLCLLGIGWFGVKRERTVVELFSLKTDQKIVAVLKDRFGKQPL